MQRVQRVRKMQEFGRVLNIRWLKKFSQYFGLKKMFYINYS